MDKPEEPQPSWMRQAEDRIEGQRQQHFFENVMLGKPYVSHASPEKLDGPEYPDGPEPEFIGGADRFAHPPGPIRDARIPSRDEMYRTLKARSEELKEQADES